MIKGIIKVEEVLDPQILFDIKEAECATKALIKALNKLPDWIKDSYIDK